MRDLGADFGDTLIPEIEEEDDALLVQYERLTDKEMYALFDNPHAITLELANRLAVSRPYNHVVMITKDKEGFAIATSHKNDVSVFMKPNAHQEGAFWEVHAMSGKAVRDPQVAGYVLNNHDMYNTVQKCLSRLQANGDSQIMLAGVKYAEDYGKMRDAAGPKPEGYIPK